MVIPKGWRKKHLKGKKVVLKLKEGSIEIIPYETFDLTEFFDKFTVNVKSDLSDWHALRKELMKS
ncbi:MAG: AbrB/MazE/SpoVT family DNA-binding domain-containing protein [Thaumarchaeota archaeon]|nr:AbrB/MazE/SpoVT family DNA-binding domain-containing protein [Nitrososphaerota archaeon]